ncbi:MAG: hypothetical protein Q7J67_07275 [bacterium]|nr:hypothetical protein [bacterium]
MEILLNVGGPNSVTKKIIELETDKNGEFHPFKSKWKYGSFLEMSAWKIGYTYGGPPSIKKGKLKFDKIIKLKKLPEGYEMTEEYTHVLINARVFFSDTKWESMARKESSKCRDIREKSLKKRKKE